MPRGRPSRPAVVPFWRKIMPHPLKFNNFCCGHGVAVINNRDYIFYKQVLGRTKTCLTPSSYTAQIVVEFGWKDPRQEHVVQA